MIQVKHDSAVSFDLVKLKRRTLKLKIIKWYESVPYGIQRSSGLVSDTSLKKNELPGWDHILQWVWRS